MLRLLDERPLTPMAAPLALAMAVRQVGQGVPGVANGGRAGGQWIAGLLRGGWVEALISSLLLIGLFTVLGCGDHSPTQGTGVVRLLDRQPRGALPGAAPDDEIEALEVLAQQSRQAWNVELDRELRKSLLVPPAQPQLLEALVPENGSLRFAVGASGRLAAPMTFRVSAIVSPDERRELFRTVLEPVESAGARRWREARVDLGAFSGERIGLLAESLVDDRFDAMLGVPVWATPEIVTVGSAGGPPNIILISIDTLRADRLSLYGHQPPISPRIDSWARRSAVTFRSAVAQAPWTLPSHCSMLTGLDPLRHGVNHPFEAAPAELVTLAERLSQKGYYTAGITGGGWLHPRYGLADGYDRYRYWMGEQRGDEELASHAAIAADWLEELREPFFLFLHSYDVHDFNAPGRMDPLGTEDPAFHAARNYDRAVSHMDQLIGDLLDRFAASGLRGRTVLALTSDHGEDLGEEGVFGHGSLRDQVLLVPLILELPDGNGAGRVIEEQVRSVDLVPTLLELVGADTPTDLDGVSLLGLVNGGSEIVPSVATSYFALQHGLALRLGNRWKYLYDNSAWKPAGAGEAFYRLPGDETGESDDGVSSDPRAARLRALAQRLLEDRLAGLELRIDNRLGEPFAGTLKGDLVDVGVPRVSTGESAWLTRLGTDTAEFSVPPGRQLRLLFEHVGEPRFELRASPDRGGAGRLAVDLDKVSLPAGYGWTGAAWARDASDEATVVSVTVEWRHGGGRDDVLPVARDPELRRQLQALGYLR